MEERKIRIMQDSKWNGAMNLGLFDAGANGSDGAQGTASAGGAAEAAAGNHAADAGQEKSKGSKGQDLSQVIYGKQPEQPETQTDAEKPPAASEKEKTDKADKKARTSFDELIQGEYKDDFVKKTQAIIDKRFRESKEAQEQMQEMAPMLELLAARYSVDKADIKGIIRAVEEDNSFYEQEAEEQGISVEQLKKQRQLERENAVLREERQRAQADENSRRIYNEWMGQAEKVREVYPGFDFAEECKNPKFLELIRSPAIDVQTAYEVIHRDEIMTGVMQHTAKSVQQKTVEDIKARGMRPAENGMKPQSSAIFKTNVNELTKEDIAEINRRVARGEKITF